MAEIRREMVEYLATYFGHRFHGLVCLNWRIGDKGSLCARAHEEGRCTVRPVFVLTQIHIDSRRERAAKDVVHGFNGYFVALTGRRGQI